MAALSCALLAYLLPNMRAYTLHTHMHMHVHAHRHTQAANSILSLLVHAMPTPSAQRRICLPCIGPVPETLPQTPMLRTAKMT